MFKRIKKRDGRIVKFRPEKITQAIAKAGEATGEFGQRIAEKLTLKVLKSAQKKIFPKTPTVEEIQDFVEEVLLSSPYHKTARGYIVYRAQHTEFRQIVAKADVSLVEQYLGKTDWQVNENSNMAFSLQGLNNYLSSEVSKIYWLNKIYPPEIRKAYEKGDFHIHDLGLISVYTYYGKEVVIAKIDGLVKLISFEKLYELIKSKEKLLNKKDEAFAKYPKNVYVLDKNRWTKAKKVVKKKKNREMRFIKNRGGRSVIVTDNHPIITEQGEKTAIKVKKSDKLFTADLDKLLKKEKIFYLNEIDLLKKVKAGKDNWNDSGVYFNGIPIEKVPLDEKNDGILHTITFTSPRKIKLTKKFGYFVGFALAEGYLSYDKKSPRTISISQKDKKNLLKANEGLIDNNISGRIIKRGNKYELEVKNPFLKFLFEEVFKIKTGSKNKTLPVDSVLYNKEFVKGMIAGLIDGDGTIETSKTGISLRISSRSMLEQCSVILSLLGFTPRDRDIEGQGAVHFYKNRKIIQNYPLYGITFRKTKEYLPSEKYKKTKISSRAWQDETKDSWHIVLNNKPANIPDKVIYDITTESGTLIVNGMWNHNCVGWDLEDLLMEGFTGVSGKVETKPAKHFRAALGQVVNFFYTLQGEAAGAQAFSDFDALLAPFIRYDNLSYSEVKQAMQEFLFNMNIPTRVGFQCVSEDTEILTSSGWKSYNEVNEGDIIKTFNLGKRVVEDKKVQSVFRRKYSGIMYNLKNRIQDQLISPKHKVVRKKFQTERFILEPIEEVLKMKSPFIIPVSAKNFNRETKISDEQIKLMAWIIGEGSIEKPAKNYRSCYRISIYQSAIKNRRNYQEIKKLLNHFHLQYSEYTQEGLGQPVQRIRIDAESSRVIHKWFGTKETIKIIPQQLLNMSQRQSRLFIDTYLKAEGFEKCKIVTSDLKILDDLQAIAFNAGYGSTVLTRKPTIGTKPLCVLRLIKHEETYIKAVRRVKYSGIIWSVHTENETIVARRNGKVFITGNTPYTNLTFDLNVPETYAEHPVIVGGELLDKTYKDFQEEMNMLNRAFLEVATKGDAKSRVFSVDGDAFCLIKNSGTIKMPKIGEYIDRLIEEGQPIVLKENQAEVVDVRNKNIRCLGLKDNQIDWQKVNFVVRHPTKELLKINLVGGYEVKVTPSHSVIVLKDGKIQDFKASELKIGDCLISPKKIPEKGNEKQYLSLAEEFVKKGKENGIYLRDVYQNGELYQEENLITHYRQYGQQEYQYPRKVNIVSLSHISQEIDKFNLTKARISLRGSGIKISNLLAVSPDLVEFLGWYCAEGSAERNNKYGGISFGLNLKKEKKRAERIAQLAKNIFGSDLPVKTRKIKKRNLIEVRIHSKLVRKVITEIFEIKKGNQRQVPELIFNLPVEEKKIFLKGYFGGDAWLREKRITVNSISRGLILGISALLKQLNIFHTLNSYQWKGRKRWRIEIWTGMDLEPKESNTISKIPIKKSGLLSLVEKIREEKPLYQDKLGRKYRNIPRRILAKFGISGHQKSVSISKLNKVLGLAGSLGIPISKELNLLRKGEVSILKVKNIERIVEKEKMVYDFSTESGNFVANHILVHNTFPIPTYNITDNFDWNNPIVDLLAEVTAKFGLPYFSNFVSSDMKPSEVRSMCCRLRLDLTELKKRGGGYFGASPQTGSIGVVTINMPRLGYLSKTEDEFLERLEKVMVLAKNSLEIKRKVLEKLTDRGLYPYTKFYLRAVKGRFKEYWKNHFSTIGLVGMNEACLNLFGEDIGSEKGRKFVLEVLDFMRNKLLEFQKETGNNYNLEATPAEGSSYRLALKDKKAFPDIICANEEEYKKGAEPYYTNSTQLPVNYTDDIFEALDLQDEIQTKYTGGTTIHIFAGEKIDNKESIKSLVKKICQNYHLPYFTITPTFSICPVHKYIAGEHYICPKCGAKCEVYSRSVGYLRPVSQWNKGKQEEFKERKTFKINKTNKKEK